jgi:hypothetical protein
MLDRVLQCATPCLVALGLLLGWPYGALSQGTGSDKQAPPSNYSLAGLGERVAALEERVLGLEHPLDSLLERTDVLETVMYGGTNPSSTAAHQFSLPERISALESAIYSHAGNASQDLPDGMSTFVDKKARRTNNRTIASQSEDSQSPATTPQNKSGDVAGAGGSQLSSARAAVSPVVPNAPDAGAAKYVNPYATPGKYSGYPYRYRGPGLAPYSYGVYPGSPGWFDSPYRQSGQAFSTQSPYYPWAANQVAPTKIAR